MSNSMPCLACLNYMINVIPMRGYRIKKIYYSTQEGSIEEKSLNDMISNNKNHHMTKLMKNKSLNKI